MLRHAAVSDPLETRAPTVELHNNLRSVMHDVTQPIAAILTNAEVALLWLARDPANIEEARCAVERIVANGHRARTVVGAAGGSGQAFHPTGSEVEINGVINELLELMSLDLRLGGVLVEAELSRGRLQVRGDRCELERLVANLIVNGVEAMSAVEDRPRKLRIRSQLTHDREVLVAVEDSGAGLDPEHAERIFEPMFTTKRDGMGLGLSICRSIVKAHGGRLWVGPNRRHGSIFRFTIPALGDGMTPESPAKAAD
jgi:signal transduction histidine kinase